MLVFSVLALRVAEQSCIPDGNYRNVFARVLTSVQAVYRSIVLAFGACVHAVRFTEVSLDQFVLAIFLALSTISINLKDPARVAVKGCSVVGSYS